MPQITVSLLYPATQTDKPVISDLVRDFGLVFNIVRADFGNDRRGRLTLTLSGESDALQAGIAYLEQQGITVRPLSKSVIWDAGKCVSCGACTGICPTEALSMEGDQLVFNSAVCIACEQCLKTCPLRAMKIDLFEVQ